MIEPLIPDAAYDAGEKAARPHVLAPSVTRYATVNTAAAVIRAAAPLIVVAELQALVDILTEKREEFRTEDDRSLRSSGVGTAIDLLRTRIDELSAVPPLPEYPSDCSQCGTSYTVCTAAIYASRGACCERCRQTATHKQSRWEAAHDWKTEPEAVTR